MFRKSIVLFVAATAAAALLSLAACDSGPASTPTPVAQETTVIFNTSGGIAGVSKQLQVGPQAKATYTERNNSPKDTTITGAQLADVVSKVDKADFFNLKDEYDNHNVADDFYYTITVKRADQAKSVKVADVGGKDITPAALRDLIDALNQLQDTVAK